MCVCVCGGGGGKKEGVDSCNLGACSNLGACRGRGTVGRRRAREEIQ